MSEPAPSAPWVPTPTLAERLSPILRRAFKLSAGLVIGLLLGAQALWALPTWLASRRPGFQALRQSVEADRGYSQAMWGPVSADAWPVSFSGEEPEEGSEDLERYVLLARGPGGVIRIEGHVRAGKVVHKRSLGIADWQAAWAARQRR